MANEKIGWALEALTYAGLQILRERGGLKENLYWNERPQAMSIEPDIVIGRALDDPSACLLITNIGSGSNSDMKTWRNLGELAEVKTVFAQPPKALNLLFQATVKPDLLRVQEAAFDGQLVVEHRPYGRDLIGWVLEQLPLLPKEKRRMPEALRKRIGEDGGGTADRLMERFVKDLERLLGSSNPQMDSLWEMERKRPKGKPRKAKTTYLRRGLTYLMVAEDREPLLRLYRGEIVREDELPNYVYELGMARVNEGLAQPANEEIGNCARLVHRLGQVGSELLKLAPMDEMEPWLRLVRHPEFVQFEVRFLADHYDLLCDANELRKCIVDLHRDPWALVDPAIAPQGWPPSSVWLVEAILELVRLVRGSGNGYGYAQLAQECSRLPQMPRAGDPVYRIDLSQWLLRRSSKSLDENFLGGVAEVLAARLRSIPLKQIRKVLSEVGGEAVGRVLEQKLMTYRGFRPLLELLMARFPGAKKHQIQSCFSERSGAAVSSGGTEVLQVGDALIRWQSAHGGNTNHKRKELCGRAIGLRYAWDPKGGRFVPRPGVKRLLLVLDGTWKEGDLKVLVRSGWDRVFYPDEIEELAKEVGVS